MLTVAMENNLKAGDLVLYKDFTEADWCVGIYMEYDENARNKCKHRIITGVESDDEGNPNTKNVKTLPYRYAVKFNIKDLDIK